MELLNSTIFASPSVWRSCPFSPRVLAMVFSLCQLRFRVMQACPVEIGRSRNWPKSNWPKSILAELEKTVGRSRNWPNSNNTFLVFHIRGLCSIFSSTVVLWKCGVVCCGVLWCVVVCCCVLLCVDVCCCGRWSWSCGVCRVVVCRVGRGGGGVCVRWRGLGCPDRPSAGPPFLGTTLSPDRPPPDRPPPDRTPPDRPKFRAFFSLSRLHFRSSSLSLSLRGLLVEFWGGVFEGRDPLMCTSGLSGCRVKPRRNLSHTARVHRRTARQVRILHFLIWNRSRT